jgi:hypothetical protein
MGKEHRLLALAKNLDIVTLENGGHGRSVQSKDQ